MTMRPIVWLIHWFDCRSDGAGRILAIRSGRDWADWSTEVRVQGNELRWRFTSDGSVNGWGWRFTVYPLISPGQLTHFSFFPFFPVAFWFSAFYHSSWVSISALAILIFCNIRLSAIYILIFGIWKVTPLSANHTFTSINYGHFRTTHFSFVPSFRNHLY